MQFCFFEYQSVQRAAVVNETSLVLMKTGKKKQNAEFLPELDLKNETDENGFVLLSLPKRSLPLCSSGRDRSGENRKSEQDVA